MKETFAAVRVAVVQAGPVMFDPEATLDKAAALVAEASARGARLVLFPEAFLSCYPRGLGFGAVVGSRSDAGRRLWQRYRASSVTVPGPATERLAELAREHAVWLAMGVVERGGDTLYCTLVYVSPQQGLVARHRKLKPTGSERLVWGEGDGSTLATVDTPWGTLGGLICWENYMPLARMTMYAKGVRIYAAPTADCRDTWQATLRHVAVEGRCFVLGCNQYVRLDDYPEDLRRSQELADAPEEICRGGSAIYSPLGDCLAGPLYGEEGLLLAELDMGEVARGKYDFDVVGHYARDDVFRLLVDERPRRSVAATEADDAAPIGGEPDRS